MYIDGLSEGPGVVDAAAALGATDPAMVQKLLIERKLEVAEASSAELS